MWFSHRRIRAGRIFEPLKKFYHQPNLGDVIYSLPVIRSMGGGHLYLDPAGNLPYVKRFEDAVPLLERQPYIQGCSLFRAGDVYDINLDAYRETPWDEYRAGLNLVEAHFKRLGLPYAPAYLDSWISVPQHPVAYPVILHRSPRYHGTVNYDFLKRLPCEYLFSIGDSTEQSFWAFVGATPLVTVDLLSLARAIASCQLFVGNQSCPLSLAVAMRQRRLIETCPELPNCTFYHTEERVLSNDADHNYLQAMALLE